MYPGQLLYLNGTQLFFALASRARAKICSLTTPNPSTRFRGHKRNKYEIRFLDGRNCPQEMATHQCEQEQGPAGDDVR